MIDYELGMSIELLLMIVGTFIAFVLFSTLVLYFINPRYGPVSALFGLGKLTEYGDSLGISRTQQAKLRAEVDGCIIGRIPVEQLFNHHANTKDLNEEAYRKCKDLLNITNEIEKLYGQDVANTIRVPLKQTVHGFGEVFKE